MTEQKVKDAVFQIAKTFDDLELSINQSITVLALSQAYLLKQAIMEDIDGDDFLRIKVKE